MRLSSVAPRESSTDFRHPNIANNPLNSLSLSVADRGRHLHRAARRLRRGELRHRGSELGKLVNALLVIDPIPRWFEADHMAHGSNVVCTYASMTSLAKIGFRRSTLASGPSGTTRVLPITDIKLVSPSQRGTR